MRTSTLTAPSVLVRRRARTALLAVCLATPLAALAATDNFIYDSAGQPVGTGAGQCVHGMSWKPGMPTCPEPTVVADQGQVELVFGIDDAEFFGFDKATLGKTARQHLDEVATAVKSADLIHGVLITGHADRLGPEPYNVVLAQKRADSAKAYLVSRGIPADKIKAVGEGLEQPWVACSGASDKQALIQCLAPNRRVDVQVLFTDTVKVEDIHLPQSQG